MRLTSEHYIDPIEPLLTDEPLSIEDRTVGDLAVFAQFDPAMLTGSTALSNRRTLHWARYIMAQHAEGRLWITTVDGERAATKRPADEARESAVRSVRSLSGPPTLLVLDRPVETDTAWAITGYYIERLEQHAANVLLLAEVDGPPVTVVEQLLVGYEDEIERTAMVGCDDGLRVTPEQTESIGEAIDAWDTLLPAVAGALRAERPWS